MEHRGTDRIIKVKSAGSYWFTFDKGTSDTLVISYARPFRVFLGNDTAFCQRFTHVLKAGIGAKSYDWSTGETTETIKVSKEGEFMVKVTDSFNCQAADTIRIGEIKKQSISILFDSSDCYSALLKVNKVDGLEYFWSTGDTGLIAKINKKGRYTLRSSHKYCSFEDTVEVGQLTQPEPDLGIDRMLCDYPAILNPSVFPGNYRWSTGDSSERIWIAGPGRYIVTVSRLGCEASDTVDIFQCRDVVIFGANAFSPNGDGLNDMFNLVAGDYRTIRLQIFSRWGEKLYESTDTNISWDGNYMGQPCPEGVYMYIVEASGYVDSKPETIMIKGSLTLLR